MLERSVLGFEYLFCGPFPYWYLTHWSILRGTVKEFAIPICVSDREDIFCMLDESKRNWKQCSLPLLPGPCGPSIYPPIPGSQPLMSDSVLPPYSIAVSKRKSRHEHPTKVSSLNRDFHTWEATKHTSRSLALPRSSSSRSFNLVVKSCLSARSPLTSLLSNFNFNCSLSTSSVAIVRCACSSPLLH